MSKKNNELNIGTKVICIKDCELKDVSIDEIFIILFLDEAAQTFILKGKRVFLQSEFNEFFKIFNQENLDYELHKDISEVNNNFIVETIYKRNSNLNPWQSSMLFHFFNSYPYLYEMEEDICEILLKYEDENTFFFHSDIEDDVLYGSKKNMNYEEWRTYKIALVSQM